MGVHLMVYAENGPWQIRGGRMGKGDKLCLGIEAELSRNFKLCKLGERYINSLCQG